MNMIKSLAASGWLALVALTLTAPLALAAETAKPKDEADIEARLAAARERLEAAAREVAELSGQLTGPIMEDMMFARQGRRAMLGINLGDQHSKEGVSIESVTPEGPASKAGLKSGDVLISIDGQKLADGNSRESPARTLIRHLRDVKPGDKVQVEYLRDGKKQKAEVVTTSAENYFTMAVPGPGRRMFAMGTPQIEPFVGAGPMMGFHAFAPHGLLDMELITLTPRLGSYFGTDKGVLVVRVPEKSDLKLEEGDVIVNIDGRVPQSGAHAMRILRSYQPGEKLALNVLRNRKSVKLDVTVPKNAGEWGGGVGMLGVMPDDEDMPGTMPTPLVPPAPPAPPAESPDQT
jgi:predicted metalloprotease with PDZ domain